MKKILSVRDLWLIKLRVAKHLNSKSPALNDAISATDCALQLLKENSLLKEKLFNIEQSISEEERILNIIDAKLDVALLSNDKEDFLEINKSINNKVWTIIIQKKFGRTPQQRLKQSEIRRGKAAQKIINLHKEVVGLNKVIFHLRKEIKVLNAFNVDDPIRVLKTRENLLRLRDLVQDKIKAHNSNVYRQGMATLHKSFHDSLREAWDRAGISDTRAIKAEQELFQIKETARKKKNISSLIYNRRKRKRGKLISKSAFCRVL